MTTKTPIAATPKDLLAKNMLVGFNVQTGADGISLTKTCAVKGGSCKGGPRPPPTVAR